MEDNNRNVESAGGDQDYTQDGTVNLKGEPISRSKTGGWRACSFIVGYEVVEKMAYYAVSTNLVLYLTDTLHEGTVVSANNVTNWVATVWLTPIFGAYIADAFIGRYWTFVVSASIYLMGMILLTLTVSVPGLRPPSCGPEIKAELCNKRATKFQKGIFFAALYIIAIGAGGTKPNISTMGAEQFDVFEPKERSQKLSFFNWWVFSIFFGTLFASTFLVYIQDNVGWALGYGLPTIGLAISLSVFFVGTSLYRHMLPSGSPLTTVAKVLWAALSNWKLALPNDPKDLYELSLEEYQMFKKLKIDHSPALRFLDKAAVMMSEETTPQRSVCTVTEVEETKQMLKMLPILAATFIPNTISAQRHTLFIEQGTTLDRRLHGTGFEIPPASLAAFITLFMLATLVLYDRLFVPIAKKYTKNPRGISLLQRLGTGFTLQVLVMTVACLMERKRLGAARESGALGKDDIIPLSVLVLLPQFALAGMAESFVETAKIEFFYDQAPHGMKSLGTSYFTTSHAVGNFLSGFLLSVVSKCTEGRGRKGWIQDDLNVSQLDYYYALLTSLSLLNLVFFLLVAKLFVYNADDVVEANSAQRGDHLGEVDESPI